MKESFSGYTNNMNTSTTNNTSVLSTRQSKRFWVWKFDNESM